MRLGTDFLTENDLKEYNFRKLGKNVLVKPNVGLYFTENISIGDNVRIDEFTIIVASSETGVTIGSYVHIASHCFIAGSSGVEMKDFSGLSPGVKVFSGSDDYSGVKLTNPTVPREFSGGPAGKVTLGRHVIIGAGSVILPSVTIGDGSSVGALSLVTKDLEPWGVYVGTPVRRLHERKRGLLELEKRLLEGKR